MLLGTCAAPVARGDAYYAYEQRSEPQGIIANQSTLHAPGTTLTTATAPLSGSGYAFGYWSLNGERVSDSLGQAKTIATFTLISNTTAIAWYFSPSADTNADGIADYLQWRYYGSLTNGGGSDSDGDGFTLSEELTRGYCPLIPDAPSDGGVMMRLSDV
ncbi:MAG: hypothetical protein IT577_24560, partial [Verrucomicrobiae bacterium]|nr:hypothetical protein [Verrucomicrobiae bacterium]